MTVVLVQASKALVWSFLKLYFVRTKRWLLTVSPVHLQAESIMHDSELVAWWPYSSTCLHKGLTFTRNGERPLSEIRFFFSSEELTDSIRDESRLAIYSFVDASVFGTFCENESCSGSAILRDLRIAHLLTTLSKGRLLPSFSYLLSSLPSSNDANLLHSWAVCPRTL